jgi:predicted regulator of amino acid metabolism with ACT domain
MLKKIQQLFMNQPAKAKLVDLMLRTGIHVSSDGLFYAGPVELSATKIGRALAMDRRVVTEAGKEIASDHYLLGIFGSLEPRAYLEKIAPIMGWDVIKIHANAASVGVVSKVTSVLADDGILVRQAIADDPELYPNPELTLMIKGKLKGKTIERLRRLKCASEVVLK